MNNSISSIVNVINSTGVIAEANAAATEEISALMNEMDTMISRFKIE